MTLYEKIKNYLSKKERDFNEGLELFAMASNHRSLMLYLQRKRNTEKLEYELNKLLKNLPARLQRITVQEKPDDQSEKDNPDTGKTDKSAQSESADQEPDDHKIITPGKVNPEDLSDEMKVVYESISQKYKEMRSIHEKMKLVATEIGRAELREKLVTLEDEITAGWKLIDEYLLINQQSTTIVKTETPPEESATDVAKAITAARSYLSRGITEFAKADDKKKKELKRKINERVDLLITNKASVSKKTKSTLIELSIIAKNTKLLAE